MAALHRVEEEQQKVVARASYNDARSHFQQVVSLRGTSLETLAFDYTYWDDMVRFVQTRDRQWAAPNIDVSLATFQASGIWIYDEDRGPVYSATTPAAAALRQLQVPDEVFRGLQRTRFCHFFQSTPAGLLEVRGATIHPTRDRERRTASHGYFFAGRLWDARQLGELSSITQMSVRVSRDPAEAKTLADFDAARLQGILEFGHPLRDFRGKPVAWLEVTARNPMLPLLNRRSNESLLFLTAFACLVLAVVSVGLMIWVSGPLRAMAAALSLEKPELLRGYARDRAEIGTLTRLISTFFEQKGALERENAERRQAEASLLAREEELRLMNRATNDVFYVWDVALNSVTWNDGLERLFGYSTGAVEPVLSWWEARVHPDDRERTFQSLQGFLTGSGELWCEEYRFQRANGTYASVLERGYLARDGAGRPVRMIGALIDLSERQALQERLQQSQKMEAIGRLAGGVAHDFNNMLAVINGYADLLTEELPPYDPGRRSLYEIRRAGERAASLTRQLLAFSRKQLLEPQVVNLNDVIRGLEQMLQRLIGEDIRVETRLPWDLGQVRVDPAQLDQAVMNLAVNARDAMPQGGTLRLETRNTLREDNDGEYSRWVCLTVADTGCGMDEETLRRVFEPFFTTKAVGEGTGLGLAMVDGFIAQSGGHVETVSAPGEGTAFHLYLPRVDTSTPLPQPTFSPVLGSAPGRAENAPTVLVVEDEALMRSLVRHVLGRDGYNVLAAADVQEAERLSCEYSGTIHLLLTDVILPGENGSEGAARLKRRRPELRVLFMSGYSDDILTIHGLSGMDNGFIHKPFSPAELTQRVAEALAGSPETAAPYR